MSIGLECVTPIECEAVMCRYNLFIDCYLSFNETPPFLSNADILSRRVVRAINCADFRSALET